MAQEIERKFLVTGDFGKHVVRSSRMIQGYLCADVERSVRVRISGGQGFLTIKGAVGESGWSRYEFEQAIPQTDVEELLTLCLPGVIDKVRHWIPAGDHMWEVDVFHGENEGLIIAEIELTSEDDVFDLPDWIGDEVTGNPKYYNAMLAKHPWRVE